MRLRSHAFLATLFIASVLNSKALAADSVAVVGPSEFLYATVDSTALRVCLFELAEDSHGRRARPAIVVFHGGGWVAGEPEWAFGRTRHFASKGMVAAAAQYRLSDQKTVTPLEAMADARAVIRWLRAHADSLGIDPNRIAAFGWSAGAHLAASAAIFPDSLADSISPIPDALILVSPALHLETDTWVRRLLGTRAAPSDISPAAHVRAGMPPTLIQVGETDSVTPLAGAQLFHQRMTAAGNRCELQAYPGVGHLFTPAGIPDDGWPQPDPEVSQLALVRVDSFLVSIGFID
jgi:acetyl esterase/lipase